MLPKSIKTKGKIKFSKEELKKKIKDFKSKEVLYHD